MRSGKSAHALRLAAAAGLAPVLIATAQAHDAEMAARIERHRRDRGPGWALIEEPLGLAAALAAAARPGRIVVVDCLTLWLTNLMLAERPVAPAIADLAAAAPTWPAPVLLVSNEVGWGGIAANPMARAFADHAGRLHQALAAVLPRVVLVAAGLPLALKHDA